MTALRDLEGFARVLARKSEQSVGATAHSLLDLADLCRRAGALDDAKALARRALHTARDSRRAKALCAILDQQPWPRDRCIDAQPFVRIHHALSAELRSAIEANAKRSIPYGKKSIVLNEGAEGYDPSIRKSVALKLDKLEADQFTRELVVLARAHRVLSVLDLEDVNFSRIVTEMTYHGDGAFFGRHTDNSAAILSGRAVTFVYYFHRTPRAFSGGDLLIYDGVGLGASMTRISPEDNSLIFFRSDAVHEVDLVQVSADPQAGGRFSINGWLMRPQSAAEGERPL